VRFIADETWWQKAENVLEIGSGTGIYLSRLADTFAHKTYLGIEQKTAFVEVFNRNFRRPQVDFREGDAASFDKRLSGTFDVVIFRLTLQHLKDPKQALEHAFHYLKPGGHILIYETIDSYRKISHPTPYCKKAVDTLNEQNKKEGKGNRQISLQILSHLQNNESPYSQMFKLVSTNLNLNEEDVIGDKRVIFKSKQERALYFNQVLNFTTILKNRQIPVDLSIVYEEARQYLDDDTSWACPGWHKLVLGKL